MAFRPVSNFILLGIHIAIILSHCSRYYSRYHHHQQHFALLIFKLVRVKNQTLQPSEPYALRCQSIGSHPSPSVPLSRGVCGHNRASIHHFVSPSPCVASRLFLNNTGPFQLPHCFKLALFYFFDAMWYVHLLGRLRKHDAC